MTVPFKKTVIPFLDDLSVEAKKTQSVNTICLDNNKVVGYNTDIDGFENSIKQTEYNVKDKKVLVLGGGGVVPSIIFALQKMNVSKIVISNRTKEKTNSLKALFKDLEIVEWGTCPYFDIIINATSIGLDNKDQIKIDYSKIGKINFFMM